MTDCDYCNHVPYTSCFPGWGSPVTLICSSLLKWFISIINTHPIFFRTLQFSSSITIKCPDPWFLCHVNMDWFGSFCIEHGQGEEVRLADITLLLMNNHLTGGWKNISIWKRLKWSFLLSADIFDFPHSPWPQIVELIFLCMYFFHSTYWFTPEVRTKRPRLMLLRIFKERFIFGHNYVN